MCDEAHSRLVGNKGRMFFQKLRHLLIADTVYIVGGVPAVLMKHDNIRNGKAVSLKVFRVVDIKLFPNGVQGHIFRKGRGINKVIICPVYFVPRSNQAVVRLKAQVLCCFVPF